MTFLRLQLLLPVISLSRQWVHRDLPQECWPERLRPLSRVLSCQKCSDGWNHQDSFLSLSLQLAAGENADRCWFSLPHKGCNLAGSSLSIILGEDYTGGASVELYLDNGVNNPSDSVQTTAGFKMQSSWTVSSSITTHSIITPTSSQLAQLFQKLSRPPSPAALVSTPKTAGEWSTFTFTFKSSQATPPLTSSLLCSLMNSMRILECQ